MLRKWCLFICLLSLAACSASSPETSGPDVSAEIIALERGALDRWGQGDPQGYLDLYSDDITYFDPASETRRDGLAAMKAYYAPIKGLVKVSRYDMIAPKVQRTGDIAVLSFQLTSFGDADKVLARWNSTEVYRRTGRGWRIVHNHWSYIKPELKVAPGE